MTEYIVKVNEVTDENGKTRGLASVILGGSLEVTGISILQNAQTGEYFVSMPKYRSKNVDDEGNAVYKEVCNPITAEFREKLYGGIIDAYKDLKAGKKPDNKTIAQSDMNLNVRVSMVDNKESKCKAVASVYINDEFVINNVTVMYGKNGLFVSNPSYKSRKLDEFGNPVYKNYCSPVTKEFREKFNNTVVDKYSEVAKAGKESVDKVADTSDKSRGKSNRKKNHIR